LPGLDHPAVLVGAGDDAAVFQIGPGRALVSTVDFFTPIVDDPETFGAIAAANSLSDIYAMGARPLFALSLVGFPRELLGTGVLERIVAGGAAKLAEVGVPVIGGHSIDDAEPKAGYVVVGHVDPQRLVTHRGARPGDLLYMTKPLCSGLVATAVKAGRCPADLEQRAVAVMTYLNRRASEAMVAAGASAATDVTGFGLIGHLVNLGVGAEVRLARVPVLEGVRELADQGLFPGGTRRNHAAYRDRVDWGGISEAEQLLLCDAQTSGGLLIAIRPERAPAFEAAMSAEPYPAICIGEVIDGPIRIRA
jgi:selenide,water dikinase